MDADTSITRWLRGAAAGDSHAQEVLWRNCFPDLVRFARDRLRMLPRRKDDAEDVALMALDSFFRAFEKGRYPELAHRDDFWRLLLKITERKAISLLRRETSQRRGKGRVRGDSALNNLKPVGPQTFVPDPEPGPELAMVMADQIEHLLEQLDDPRLKGIALAKMEGSTTSEMASRFQWSRSSVHRCVRLIRSIWEEELRNESAF